MKLNFHFSDLLYFKVVVEKKIMKERGLTRHDLGREKFVEEVCVVMELQ